MSEQHEREPTNDARLDENLSRLIHRDTRQPRLSPDAEEKMLTALLEKQAEIKTESQPFAEEDTQEKVVNRSTTTQDRSASRATNFQSIAALSLVAVCAVVSVIGAFFWSPGPDDVPPEGLGPLAEVPSATFEAGQVTRKQLEDGTILIAHSGTKFTLVGRREISLSEGDLYLIVAKNDEPFVVKTEDGDVTATGTRFAVSSDERTSAAVAQGTVTLTSKSGSVELQAGEQGELRAGEKPTRRPAPRLSYLVNWAKEALAQDELLVEKAESENGLVAMDPWGQQTKLTLRKYHVDVHIEDGIARTTIDQTFFNHYPWNSEGTFYFPLPPDASVSRLAMYVFGELNEGGMVERGRGQQIYNDILYQRRDPALLEMMEGNVFKMRIFPLEGRQEKRIFLSYTQKLDELYGRGRYWFPMDHTNSIAGDLSIRVRIKDGAKSYDPQSSTHDLETNIDGDDLVLTYDAKKTRPDQDLLLHLVPSAAPEATRVATCEKDGQKFVFARFSPEIPGQIEPQPRQWVVVNDVSASRSKIDAQAQRYILDRLIEEADDNDSLFLINLNTRPELISQKFTPIRSAATKKLLQQTAAPRLGATNLVTGMEAAAKVIADHDVANPHILYLGDGVATDGSQELFEPVRAVPRRATFVGIGVGKKVDSLFLQEAADRTGGAFTTINPDEDIDWRVFDLVASLNTPRLTKIRVELQDALGKPIKAIAYPNSRSLSHGETLTVVARCEEELPANVVLRGDVGEKPYRSLADVSQAKPNAEYIPRLWAKRHIDELLKSDMGRDKEIIELSKQYYVVTPLTSLIVLEDDKMYEEYNVERGRKDHWALYNAPKKIEVVKEPIDWDRWGWYGAHLSEDDKIKAQAKPKTVREIIDSVQVRIDAPFYYWQPQRNGKGRYALYQMLDSKADPSRLLTYWMLLAAGEKQLAGDFRQGRSGDSGSSPSTSGQPDGSTALQASKPMPAMKFGYIGRDMILPALVGSESAEADKRLLLPMAINGKLAQSKLASESTLFPVADALLPAGEMVPSMMLGKFKDLAMGPRLPSSQFAVSGRLMLPLQMQSSGSGGGAAPPLPTLLEGLSLGTSTPVTAGVMRLELASSFQRELSRRWSRIDQDIQNFNRQYGYWGDWGGWYESESLDLTRSAGANWYGGLDELVEELEEEPEIIAPVVDPLPLESKKQLPPLSLLMAEQGQGQGQRVAVAWLNNFRQSLRAQPGACSVLAADYLIDRRDELAGDDLTDAEKIERRAIDHALQNIDASTARLESTGMFWGYQGWNHRPQTWSFQPPTVQVYQNYNWSYDLTRYTPALHSNSFDMLNEVATQYGGKPNGEVAEDARNRIEAARAAISAVTIRYAEDGPALHIASGDRFAMTRRTEMSLEEQMVCDGEQILHQYQEIGLAARRSATALRLATLRQLAPHLVEPADALAQRYHVVLSEKSADDFELRLTPIGQDADAKNPIALLVRVGNSGRILAKTLSVDGEVRLKLAFTYDDDEITVAWFDAEDKELTSATYFAEPLEDLAVFEGDAAELVVIDMPLRKPSFYEQQINEFKEDALGEEIDGESVVREKIKLQRHYALSLIQQLQWRRWGGTNSEARQALHEVFRLAKAAKQEVKIGDLTLLGSAGDYNAAEAIKQHATVDEHHPVYKFYKLRSSNWKVARKDLEGHMEGLLGHLAAYQASSRNYGEVEYYDFFAKTFPDSPLLLAATYFAANWGNNPQAWSKLYENEQWGLMAMLMSAPQANTAEQRTRFAEAYLKLYDEWAKQEVHLPLTAQIVTILKDHEEGKAWKRISADRLAQAKKAESTALLLKFAEEAMSWGEVPLADEALALARERLADEETLSGRFALAQTYWSGNRTAEAMKLYDEIFRGLDAKQIPPSAGLLASAARLAQQSGDLARAIELEEQALAAEHPYLPDMINLQAFRQRYSWLWQQYQAKVNEAVGNKDEDGKRKWLARAEATWQRWFEIDADNHSMITQMATLQMTAGNEADAWLYLSTIIDQRPRDANSHYALSQWYRGRNNLEDAEERLAQAYEWDTANPRWLWERGQLLQQMDRPDEARAVYQQIVDGEWANGLQGYVEQAKQALQN